MEIASDKFSWSQKRALKLQEIYDSSFISTLFNTLACIIHLLLYIQVYCCHSTTCGQDLIHIHEVLIELHFTYTHRDMCGFWGPFLSLELPNQILTCHIYGC